MTVSEFKKGRRESKFFHMAPAEDRDSLTSRESVNSYMKKSGFGDESTFNRH